MNKIFALYRFLRAVWVLMREGVIKSLPGEDLSGFSSLIYKISCFIARKKDTKSSRSERISRAMHVLGPSYIKLGQFLATRPDIVGADISSDLSRLQDRMKTFLSSIAIYQIENSLGRKINDIFYKFGEPIAAASMAQVHPAWIRNSDGSIYKVAVKVVRPGLKKIFSRDIKSFFLIANILEKFAPKMRRLNLVSVVENLKNITRLEMDMRFEAAAISEMSENVINDTGFRVPKIFWEYIGRDVLTMEWIEGIKISEVEKLVAFGHEPNKIAITLIQSFLRHTLRDGFFHADMHPGNLFIDKKGAIVAVDFGIMGRLKKREKRFLAEIIYGFIHRDYFRISKIHFDAGYVPKYHSVESFAQANRAIGEPIHGKSVETISMARLLSLLFEITELFDMKTRSELLLLQKTMIVVEGVARSIDPKFNMWKAAEPIVSEWIQKNLGPSSIFQDISEFSIKAKKITKYFDDIIKNLDKTSFCDHCQHKQEFFFLIQKIQIQNRLMYFTIFFVIFIAFKIAF